MYSDSDFEIRFSSQDKTTEGLSTKSRETKKSFQKRGKKIRPAKNVWRHLDRRYVGVEET
jgi:uncharacterized coiled-coil protein SlyX